jgi:hypothetical protein
MTIYALRGHTITYRSSGCPASQQRHGGQHQCLTSHIAAIKWRDCSCHALSMLLPCVCPARHITTSKPFKGVTAPHRSRGTEASINYSLHTFTCPCRQRTDLVDQALVCAFAGEDASSLMLVPATVKCASATSRTCDQRTGSPVARTSSSSHAGNGLHQIELPVAASYMAVAVKAVTALSVYHESLCMTQSPSPTWP